MQVDRFIFEVVVLQAERMTGVHMNQLADVAFRLRPMQLVAPWFFNSRDDVAQRTLLEEDAYQNGWTSAAYLTLDRFVVDSEASANANSRSISSTVARRRTRRA